jgi:hypothetical protein
VAEPTDEEMRASLARTREYTVVILHPGPNYGTDEAGALIWEHGRRNFDLRDQGKLAIVCPVPGGGAVSGVGIFTEPLAATRELLDGDPAIAAGVLTYEAHATRSFPGDALP